MRKNSARLEDLARCCSFALVSMVALAELGGLSAWADPPSHALSIVVKTGDTISGLTLTNVVCPVINDRGDDRLLGFLHRGLGHLHPLQGGGQNRRHHQRSDPDRSSWTAHRRQRH